MKKLSTDSYKGVRDFYPEDMFVQNYIFDIWKKTMKSFGYEEYNASVLEPSDLYKAKTGEEIVNEQTYTFIDRGDREVTLRPEMTPSLARMVSKRKRELPTPLRWFSIPNLFRYEAPQRGRLREHWQLNTDIFGISSKEAEIEIITIAYKLMKNFGAKDSDFQIRVNSRAIINKLYKKFNLNEKNSQIISKLIDKKNKISSEIFTNSLNEILGKDTEKFEDALNSSTELIKILGEDSTEVNNLIQLIEELLDLGVSNIMFDQTLMRGFDYYTGFVFEVYDTNKENKRSLFGGGRYDDLLSLFGNETLPAVGFGAGDVTIADFLQTRALLPKYRPNTELYICRPNKENDKEISLLAERLRDNGVCVSVDWSTKKIGDQIKSADKQKIPFIVCVGDEEIKSKKYKIKELSTGNETLVGEEDIKNIIKK